MRNLLALPKLSYAILMAALLYPACVAAQTNSYRQLKEFKSCPTTKTLIVDIEAASGDFQLGGRTFGSNVYKVSHAGSYPKLFGCDFAPPSRNVASDYGGSVLHVNPGDRIFISFRNNAEDSVGVQHGTSPLEWTTNLHLHGTLVRAHGSQDIVEGRPVGVFGSTSHDTIPQDAQKNYLPNSIGDFIFASAAVSQSLLYEIDIPADHPSGIFWLHPHVHGLAKPQVASGMAIMIEVGSMDDYTCIKPLLDGKCPEDGTVSSAVNKGTLATKSILLKDAQLVKSQKPTQTRAYINQIAQIPTFCDALVAQTNTLFGMCRPGTVVADPSPVTGTGDEENAWVFSVNGVQYPQWDIPPGQSEIWRIQNASANITYDLCLRTAITFEKNAPTLKCDDTPSNAFVMPFQVLSIDGGVYSPTSTGSFVDPNSLQKRIILMPGSRVEILVSRHDLNDANCQKLDAVQCGIVKDKDAPPQPLYLTMASYMSGAPPSPENGDAYVGDVWTQTVLARANFQGVGAPIIARMKIDSAVPSFNVDLARYAETAKAQVRAKTLAKTSTQFREHSYQVDANELCRTGMANDIAQMRNHKRRIYFGVVKIGDQDKFVLGATIIEEDLKNGTVTEFIEKDGNLALVDGMKTLPILREFPAHDHQPAQPALPAAPHVHMPSQAASAANSSSAIIPSAGVNAADLCVPAGGVETWQLVNISAEVHNFHIHQNKFDVAECVAGQPCEVSTSTNRQPAFFAVSDNDRIHMNKALVLPAASANVKVGLHDTIIVPRGDSVGCLNNGALASDKTDLPSFLTQVGAAGAGEYQFNPNGRCRVITTGTKETATAQSKAGESGNAGWIEVKIPFDKEYHRGRYVFHCHILEHEDAGMMASIRVLTTEQLSKASLAPMTEAQ